MDNRASELQVAMAEAKSALAADPESAVRNYSYGALLLDSGKALDALPLLQKSVSADPSTWRYRHALGTALLHLSRFEEAASQFREATELEPAISDPYWGLATALIRIRLTSEAVQALRTGVDLAPSAEGYFQLGWFLGEDGKPGEGEIYYRKALELDPNHAKAREALGVRLQHLGRFEEARELFAEAIKMNPDVSGPYLWLLRERTVSGADGDLVKRLEEMFAEPNGPKSDRLRIAYALGKAAEDNGNYAQAMEYFDEANRCSFEVLLQGRRYPAERKRVQTDLTQRRFTREFLSRAHPAAQLDSRPVFIVGMMRSGTTLLEQMLSNHPAVTAGGELKFWTDPLALKASDLVIRGIDATDLLRRVGEEYEEILQRISSSGSKVTDKNPFNYLMLGLIRMLFPNSKIIHCRRNAVDTCLSIYTTPLRGADFLFDKESIVAAYGEYRRLMGHWRLVLPNDCFYEYDYESLVSQPEATLRGIFEFLEIEWHSDCLQPEKNPREVATPSLWQVRQPLYGASVGRWRKYEPYLGIFRRLASG